MGGWIERKVRESDGGKSYMRLIYIAFMHLKDFTCKSCLKRIKTEELKIGKMYLKKKFTSQILW